MRNFAITLGCALTLTLSSHEAGAAASSPCGRVPGYHQLDFTLGTWTIADPKGNDEGRSTIRTSLDGCALVESWSAPGESGRNVDAFDREDGHWYRLFINTNGQVHAFRGLGTPHGIRYTGTSVEPDGTSASNDLTITPDGPSKIRQVWRQTRDGGKTWTTVFEGTYTRTKG